VTKVKDRAIKNKSKGRPLELNPLLLLAGGLIAAVFCMVILLYSATTPTSWAEQGDLQTYSTGDEIRVSVGNETFILTITGMGPKGIDITGSERIQQAGDKLVRTTNLGRTMSLGEIKDIRWAEDEVDILIYAPFAKMTSP
jgi:hypothetical protein